MATKYHMQQYLYVGHTLVDVTKTNQKNNVAGHEKERNQQRNWETLVQVLGLRTQLTLLDDPKPATMDVGSLQFGTDFAGEQTVWQFRFGTETPDVYSTPDSPVGALEKDCASVPVILGLDETAELSTPMFCVSGSQKNIVFAPTKL